MLKYFTIEEFNCKHTGKNEMDNDFLEKLDLLRSACGFSFEVTSGYRDIINEFSSRVPSLATDCMGC